MHYFCLCVWKSRLDHSRQMEHMTWSSVLSLLAVLMPHTLFSIMMGRACPAPASLFVGCQVGFTQMLQVREHRSESSHWSSAASGSWLCVLMFMFPSFYLKLSPKSQNKQSEGSEPNRVCSLSLSTFGSSAEADGGTQRWLQQIDVCSCSRPEFHTFRMSREKQRTCDAGVCLMYVRMIRVDQC